MSPSVQRGFLVAYTVLTLVNVPFLLLGESMLLSNPAGSANAFVQRLASSDRTSEEVRELMVEWHDRNPSALAAVVYSDDMRVIQASPETMTGRLVNLATADDYSSIVGWIIRNTDGASEKGYSLSEPAHLGGRGIRLSVDGEPARVAVITGLAADDSPLRSIWFPLQRLNYQYGLWLVIWWIIPATYISLDHQSRLSGERWRWFFVALTLTTNALGFLLYTYVQRRETHDGETGSSRNQ